MPKLKINGKKITADPGTTILEAAAANGVEIPHFCYHPALSRPANCRMCLVECAAPRGGKLVPFPKLQPACYTTVTEGMEVQTESDQVVRARKAVLEFILLNHPVDCPICDQAGECKLQDFYFQYSAQESRLKTRKVHKVKVFPIGPEIVYDGERCILCTRCVRFCDEITETRELTTVQRADMSEIRTFPGMDLDNDYSICTVDLCPVGALTDRDFRFKCRVWYLETTPSVCTGCAQGCNIHLEHFKDEVQRYRPRVNHDVNGWWMCDHGRRTYREIHADRILSPSIKARGDVPTTTAIAAAVRGLRNFVKSHGAPALGVALSPQMPCEDLAALIDLGTALGVTHFYQIGKADDAFTLRREPDRVSDAWPVEITADERHALLQHFGNLREIRGADAAAIQEAEGIDEARAFDIADIFGAHFGLIHADKNPNTFGLELLADQAGITLHSADELLADVRELRLGALYLTGSHLPFNDAQLDAFTEATSSLELFIYQAPYDRPFAPNAHVVLPTCSHAEREGSFVNFDGLHQRFQKAFDPHGLSQPDHVYLAKLSKRLGAGWSHSSFAELARDTAKRLTGDSDDAAPADASAAPA